MRLMTLISELMGELEKGRIKLVPAYELSSLSEDIQRYIYEKKYFLTAQTKEIKAFKDAKTKQQIDEIMSGKSMKYRYMCRCPFKKPNGYELMPFFVHKGDEEAVRDFLKQSLDTEAGKALPEKTREILRKVAFDN